MVTISWVTGRRLERRPGPGRASGAGRARLRPALRASPKESARDGAFERGLQDGPDRPVCCSVRRLDSGQDLGGRGIGDVLGFERHVVQVDQRVLVLGSHQFLGLSLGIHARHGAGQWTLG
jgi:hypothetical protein